MMNRAIRRALAYANRKQGQPQTPQAAAPVPVRPSQPPITRQKDLPPDPTRSKHTQERKRFQDGGGTIEEPPKKEYAPFNVLPFREDETGIHFDKNAGLLGPITRGLKIAHQAAPTWMGGEGHYDPNNPEDFKATQDLAGLAFGSGTAFNKAPRGAIGSFAGPRAEGVNLDTYREAQKAFREANFMDPQTERSMAARYGWHPYGRDPKTGDLRLFTEGSDAPAKFDLAGGTSKFIEREREKLERTFDQDVGIPGLDISPQTKKAMIDERLAKDILNKGVSGPLNEFYSNPYVFSAYPHFENMQLNIVPKNKVSTSGNAQAAYKFRRDNAIKPYVNLAKSVAKNPQEAKLAVAHELQHGGQHFEDTLGPITNWEDHPNYPNIPNPAYQLYQEALVSDPTMQKLKVITTSPDFVRAKQVWNDQFKKRQSELFRTVNGVTDFGANKSALIDKLHHEISAAFPAFAEAFNLTKELEARGIPPAAPSKYIGKDEAYILSQDEAQARNTEYRHDWDDLKRQMNYPKDTMPLDSNSTGRLGFIPFNRLHNFAHGGTVDGHNPMSKKNLDKALDVALSATHPKRLHHTLARTGYAEGGIPDIQGPAELAGETPYTHGKTLASQFDVAKVQPYKAAKIAPGPVDVKLPKKSMVRAPRADIGKMRMHKPKMKKFKGLQFAKGGAAIEDALNLASRTMADMAKGIGREDGLHGASMQQGATSTIVKEKLPGKKSEVVYEHHAKTPVEREEFAGGGRAELADGGDPMQQYAANLKATGMPQSQIDAIIGSQTQQAPTATAAPAVGSNPAAPVAAAQPQAPTAAPVAAAAPATATAPQPQVSDLLTKYYGSSNQGIADYINKQIQSGTYTMPQVDAWLQTPEAKSWYNSATAPTAQATSAAPTTQKTGSTLSLQTTAQPTTPNVTALSGLPAKSTVFIQGNPYYITTPEEAKVMKANGTLPSNFMYASGLQNLGINNLIATGSNDFGGTHYVAYTPQTAAQYGLTYSANPTTTPTAGGTTPTTGGTTPTAGGTTPTAGGTGTGPQQRQVIDRQAYDQAYQQWLNGYNQWKQQVDVINLQIATKQIGGWPWGFPKEYSAPPNPAAYVKTVEETAPSQEQMNAFANTIIGRNITSAEAKQWQDIIKAGGTNQQIINAMSTSDMAKDYTLQQIHDLYAQSTGLSPTPEQLKTIADDIGAKKYTFSQLQSSLNSSPEAAKYNQTLVANAYKDSVGLDLPPEQAAAISKDVQAGKYSLGQLRDAWANSTQGQSNDIQQLYKNVTGQDLSPAQLNDLNSALTNKTYTADQIRDSISNMPQAIDTTRQQFAQDTLGRKLSSEELQKWSDYVAQGQTPEDQQNLSYEYQQSLLNTPEAKSNENAQLVKDTFDAYGITNPTPEQINNFADALNKGTMTPEQMDAAVEKLPNAGTGEYIAPYQVAGSGAGKVTGVPITPVRYTNWAKDVINNSFDVLQQGLKPFMDVLAGKEAGTAGYDAFNNPGNKISGGAGKTVEGALGKPLDAMTVGEVMQRQSGSPKNRDFFAVGKYQIIPSTLKALVKRMGIDPNEKFTDQLQEKLGAGLAILQRPALGKFLLGLPGGSLKQAGIETAREWRSMPDPRTGKTYQDKGSRGNKALITTRELNDTLLKTRANLQGAISFAPEGAGIIPKKGTPQPDTTSAPPPKTDEQLISEFLSSQGIPLGDQYQQQLDLLRQLGISGAGGNVGQGAFGLGGVGAGGNVGGGTIGAAGQPFDGNAALSQSLKDQQAAFDKQFSLGANTPQYYTQPFQPVAFPGGPQRFDNAMEAKGYIRDPQSNIWMPPPWVGDTAGSGSNSLSYLSRNRGGRMTGENRDEYAEGGACGDSEYGFSVDCPTPKRQTPPSWQIGKPTPGSVKSASTPGSKKGSVATPEFYFPPEEYKKGNLGKGKFSMKSGGRMTGNEEALRIADHYANGGGAWTRKEGKNPKGGLNAKGRASLRAQGHDIRPPAPHPKTDKDAARRKSFCARMSGMPGPMKDDNGKPTRKALSLRAWNCRADGGMIDDALRLARSKMKE